MSSYVRSHPAHFFTSFFFEELDNNFIQDFDVTYFFREVKIHEILAHDFIKRGEVKFSSSIWAHYFFREVKIHEVFRFFW